MRPSISVTLEPGLEQGVPWGRDLYTFVTSAAGHMMRTLQKPRKNRPSKRQVNHRRFLHNMIQRKFADIEAANHRLASALYFKEEEKNVSSVSSQKPETLEQTESLTRYLQEPDKCKVHNPAEDVSKSRSDVSVGLHESEFGEKKQPDSGYLWKRHPRSQPTSCATRKNNQSIGKQKKERCNHKLVEFTSMSPPIDYHHGAQLVRSECHANESLLKSANNVSGDSQTTQLDFMQFGQNVDISPVFSPGLSPLSLDSCDFSIQMLTDISTCTQAQKNIADISESQWTDIMDLYSASDKDLGGCVDVEAYFESICACQGDVGKEIGDGDVGFSVQSDSFTERLCSIRSDDVHCETGGHRYPYGYSSHGNQGLTINHFQGGLKQNIEAAETQVNNMQDIIPNQVPISMSYHYNVSELQAYQLPEEESHCMLVNNRSLTPFEGVAQSFSVPLLIPEHRSIPTLPQEADWLFTDILKDRNSPEC